MRTFDFGLTLDVSEDFDADAFLDAVEEPLFEAFEGDVTPGVLCGVPYLSCTVEAETMEGAVAVVVPHLVGLGLTPARAEFPVFA